MVFRRHPAIATPGVRRRGRSTHARRGRTTLAEQLATLAVVGTFVSTTMLTSSQVRPLYIIHGAARQVASDLQKGRMSAVTENNRYVVQITSNHTYTILDDDNNDGQAETGEPVRTVDIQWDWPGVTMSAGSSLTFLPDGTVSAPVVITLKNAGTMDKTISISQAGSIRIQ